MHTVLAVATLAAALGAAPDAKPDARQIKLAAPGLGAVNLPKDRAEFLGNHFAQEMNNRGVRVITAQEVNAILGLARTQQLMGCDESSTSCMTELADALGVDGVITGSIGLFGRTHQANVTITSNGDGRLLGSVTVKADSEQRLLEELTVAARRAAAEVGASLGKPARRFAQQSLYVDPVELAFGRIGLHYDRALSPRWSFAGSFSLGLDQPVANFPDITTTRSILNARARLHFLDTPPYGLYLGGGLGFSTGYGFGNVGGFVVTAGFSAFALTAEVGYAIALFDFLHLSVGLVGFLGIGHIGGFDPAVGFVSTYFPLVDGTITTGLGWAF